MRKSQSLIMSFLGRERDREFELELLKIQLEHDRKVALYSVQTALGTSFLLFALTVGVSVAASGVSIPLLWIQMIWAYLIVGMILLIVSGISFLAVKASTRKDMEAIRKKYSDW